jgi:glycine/D-amino acid oxidase-like deaminating enzyme
VGGGAAGVAGLALMASNPPLAVVLLLVMLVASGRPLQAATSRAVDGVVDWLWEDPVLRRRLLGE